jgi:ankyrin repeat protein
VEVARVLIEAHGDVNAPTQDSYTPLHIAAAFGQAEMAELLLKHGAAAQAMANGVTARDLATVLGHREMGRVWGTRHK